MKPIYSAIVCVDSDLGIGYKDDLLFKSKTDLRNFKEVTNNKIVIMGRKTADSIINMGGKLLPNRTKFILTTDKEYSTGISDSDTHIFHTMRDVYDAVKSEKYNTKDNEVVIIGGQEIYSLFLDQIEKLYITVVHHSFENKDTYFPLEDYSKWDLRECVNHKDEFEYSICVYKRGRN